MLGIGGLFITKVTLVLTTPLLILKIVPIELIFHNSICTNTPSSLYLKRLAQEYVRNIAYKPQEHSHPKKQAQ